MLFKEIFLPNYLKASSATWWRCPRWPAHPPTVCLGGGSTPHPASLPPTPLPRGMGSPQQAVAGQEGGQGAAARCLYSPPLLSKPSFVGLAVALGEESPLYRAAPAVPPWPGGAPSAGARCLAFPTGCFTELFTWFEIIKCRKEKKKRRKIYILTPPSPVTRGWAWVFHLCRRTGGAPGVGEGHRVGWHHPGGLAASPGCGK